MIESVQARQRGAYHFEEHYDNLCALQDTAPLAAVKAHLDQGVIDLNGDRIRINDWVPIINTIKINKSLQFIAVRSYYQLAVEEDEKRQAILKRKLPSIRSKEITHRMCKALKECMFVSPTLSCIELQGLALRDRDLQVLVKGILRSQALRHLSLETGRIGDQGLEILCKGLKNSKHINSVNLSGCSLSAKGAEYLAGVIKHQGMQRHNEAWRDSLRYRRPDLDRMSGLRRITINNNPMLGDEGARVLAEALKDDLWLKALDLQGCGVSTAGTRSFLDVLKFNTTLVVLDLRRNPLVDRDVLHSLMEQLMLNSNGEGGEYKWMKATSTESLHNGKAKRKTTKVLSASHGKKTTIKILPNGVPRRKKLTPVATRQSRVDIPPSPGLPWRTAARANRFRGHPPDRSKFLEDSQNASSSVLITSTTNNNNIANSDDDDGDDDDTLNVVIENDKSSRMQRVASDTAEAIRLLEESHLSMDLTNEKEVLIELEQMRRHLREERLARAKADHRVMTLMLENRRLTEEIESLKRKQRINGGLADDEAFLDSIESSFKQFHAFIDMLKEAGLGQLVSIAGLDQSQMPFNGLYGNGNSNGNDNTNYPKTSSPSMVLPMPGNDSVCPAGLPKTSTPSASPQRPQQAVGAPTPKLSKPTAEATAFSANYSTASFSEQPLIVVGALQQEGGGPGDGSKLEETKDAAKKEADELYNRLLQDTHGTLTTSTPQSPARGTNGYAEKWSDKYGETPDSPHVEEGWGTTNKYINKSYDEPSSFLSEQDASIVREENVVSIEEIEEGEGSDNEDF